MSAITHRTKIYANGSTAAVTAAFVAASAEGEVPANAQIVDVDIEFTEDRSFFDTDPIPKSRLVFTLEWSA